MQSNHPMVLLTPVTVDQASLVRTIDELNSAVVAKQEVVGYFANRRAARVLVTTNGKKQLMLCWCQPRGLGLLLTPALEAPKPRSKS